RFVMPGRAPNCSPAEVQMDLGSAGGAADLEARLTALEEANLVTRLQDLEEQVPDCLKAPDAETAVFEGCNVQIVNGVGATDSTNALGNLIIGYNENQSGYARNGSHNLVVGRDHGYTSYGGFVAG